MSKIIIELPELVPAICGYSLRQVLEDDHIWRIIIVSGYLGFVGIHGKGDHTGE